MLLQIAYEGLVSVIQLQSDFSICVSIDASAESLPPKLGRAVKVSITEVAPGRHWQVNGHGCYHDLLTARPHENSPGPCAESPLAEAASCSSSLFDNGTDVRRGAGGRSPQYSAVHRVNCASANASIGREPTALERVGEARCAMRGTHAQSAEQVSRVVARAYARHVSGASDTAGISQIGRRLSRITLVRRP